MLPIIPFIPQPAPVIPEPLSWEAGRAVDPDGVVVTITPREFVEADLATDEDGQEVETTSTVTRYVVAINGKDRSTHADERSAQLTVEIYRASSHGLANA